VNSFVTLMRQEVPALQGFRTNDLPIKPGRSGLPGAMGDGKREILSRLSQMCCIESAISTPEHPENSSTRPDHAELRSDSERGMDPNGYGPGGGRTGRCMIQSRVRGRY